MKMPKNLFFINDEVRKVHEKMFRREIIKIVDSGVESNTPKNNKIKKFPKKKVVTPPEDDGPDIA